MKESHTKHYQLRLVRRILGSRVVTHRELARPKGLNARDQTMEYFADSDKEALKKARDYCNRGQRRKGKLPGPFLGVVVVRHKTDSSEPLYLRQGSFEVSKRPRRLKGTTEWLFYVAPNLVAYEIDVKGSRMDIGNRVDEVPGKVVP